MAVCTAWLCCCLIGELPAKKPVCSLCRKTFDIGLTTGKKPLCGTCLPKRMPCSICQNKMEVSYHFMQEVQRAFCKKCWKKYPKCHECGVPSSNGTKIAGKILCSGCVEALPACFACADPIIENRYSLDFGTLCRDCFEHLPKCRRCNLPLAEAFKMVRGERFCHSCYEKLPDCKACGLRINGPYRIFPKIKGAYCNSCFQDMHRCKICSLPVDKKYKTYDDGRSVCSSCHRDGVFDPDTARQYFDVVKVFLSRSLKMKMPRIAGLFLVGSDKLKLLKGPDAPDEIQGIFYRDRGYWRVYVAYGLPPSYIMSTLAHEYAHVWQQDNCPAGQSRIIIEGFAEWVEFKVMECSGSKHQMLLSKMQEDVSGDGLRLMKSIERKRGINGVFKYVKSTIQHDG